MGTIPQAEIVNFCNGDNYTGYGNNGSVKKYFYDNSNGLLTYSNVVTIYIRVPAAQELLQRHHQGLRRPGQPADHGRARHHEGAAELHHGHPADASAT